jgi:hypothetical protein
MKKIIPFLFVAFSILLSNPAKAHTYHPFPDSNAMWNIDYVFNCIGVSHDIYSIVISGDTVINSQTYHKLSTSYVQILSTGSCGDRPAGYKGAIRQDIINKKVFIIPPTLTDEQLLYDFNMKVGDTVKGFIETYGLSVETVISIDSILVGSNYHKRWLINSAASIYFIEGIGSTYGLLEYSPGNSAGFPEFSITCFQKDGQSLYPSTATNCQLINSVESFEDISNRLTISPNPFNLTTLISLNQSYHNIALTIYDIQGKLILQNQYTDCNQIQLNRNQLSNGLYFLKLTLDDKWVEAQKIVVSD